MARRSRNEIRRFAPRAALAFLLLALGGIRGWAQIALLTAVLAGCGDDPNGAPGDVDGSLPADARVRDGAPAPDRDLPLTPDAGPYGPYCGLDFAMRAIPSGHACTGSSLELGLGEETLMPISQGDTVTMVMGPQGGLMLLLAWRARGIDMSAVTLCARQSFAGGGAEVGFDCWSGSLAALTRAGAAECVGLIAQTSPMYWGMPQQVLDHDITLDLSVTDKNGCQLRATPTVHVAPTVR